ncbi:hypothetical protein RE6C_02877 [Rhodopirellula europaea 6C]|uniref:Uncharacterized protein n=1 Tax=Rhodopirellula europaea 6C TaxID=1263867 RepID=M2AV00_9BACT|nr:hypothetical protein RE6C_02877 [Rhodopirellula europaea 6C]
MIMQRTFFIERRRIKNDIHVDGTNMALLREMNFWNPAANHDKLTAFVQQRCGF